MFGWVTEREPGHREKMRLVDGVCFRMVYIARGKGVWAWLSAALAAMRLRRMGVRQALFPTSYPYRTVFERCGIAGIHPAPLYRATAAAIVCRYMAQRGIEKRSATLLFRAERVTPEVCRAVELICAETRYMVLAAGGGGESFSREMALRHGVALRLCSPDEQVGADLTVCFDAGGPGSGAVLRLDDSLCVEYNDPRPPELLAALWSAGVLDAAKLEVRKVIPPPE